MKVKISIILLALVIIASIISMYVFLGNVYVSTSSAYIHAHITQVRAKVGGEITKLYVVEHQSINKGDKVLLIDEDQYNIAHNRAKAHLALAKQDIATLMQKINVEKANITELQLQEKHAKQHFKRYATLFHSKSIPVAHYDRAKMALSLLQARLVKQTQYLKQLQIEAGSVENNAKLDKAKTAVNQALLDLDNTVIEAPSSGYIANLRLRPGNLVKKNQLLFSIVEKKHGWVEANFKETKLNRLKVGQKVKITIDMYPGKVFGGTISKISHSSGAVFSLFPPENATGNWIKITQRFPVIVKFDQFDQHYPLRVGASAHVSVDTLPEKNKQTTWDKMLFNIGNFFHYH